MRTSCLIFDFDGTLADTSEGILRTSAAMMESLGLTDFDESRMKKSIGLPLKLSLTTGCDIPEELQDKAVENYRKFFEIIAYDYITLFDGVKPALKAFYERGIKLGIATSRSPGSLHRILADNGVEQYFSSFAAVNCAKNPKPAPDLALYVLNELGESAENTIVVGDTTFDLGMGRNAGCRTCAVTYGNHSREQLEEAKPDFIVDNLLDLVELI